MLKILRVGDAHTKIGNLEDSEKLLQFILDTAKKFKVGRIEFLGDQFDNHAILRVEILNFWNRWLIRLSAEFEVIFLCGNHDLANQRDPLSLNALEIFKQIANPNLKVITESTVIGKIHYVPYIHDKNLFVVTCNSKSLSAELLVCHFTVDGAKYDNGFFAPDGVDQNLLNYKQIISGHIHMEATYGKVWYVGTPKWDSASDANLAKGIWLCEHGEDGLMTEKTFISTWGVVTPIISLVWNEGQEQPEIPAGTKASVEIVGSATFVSKAKALLKGTAKIKTKVTDKVIRENRKSSKSIYDFLENNYTSKNKDKLVEYLKEKNYV